MMPDDLVGPVLDPQLLGGEQRGVGADALLADELGGPGAVEVDQVGEVGGLVAGVGADLAGLGLHRVEHPLLVVEQPVAQLAEPVVAALDPHRLPLGLVGANPSDGRGDGVGRIDRNGPDQLARSPGCEPRLRRLLAPAPRCVSVLVATVPLSTTAPFARLAGQPTLAATQSWVPIRPITATNIVPIRPNRI